MFLTKEAPKDYEVFLFEAHFGEEAEFNRGAYEALIEEE